MAAVLFAVAVLARNEIVSFVAALILLTGYGVAGALLQDIQHEKIAALLDPFGIRAFDLVTRYWTVAEKNSIAVGFTGLLLWNRLLWIGVGCLVFAVAYSRFSFAERSTKPKPVEADAEEAIKPVWIALPRPQLHDAPWTKFVGSFKIHFLGMARSTFFIVIAVASLLNCIPSIALSATEGYGNQTLPVTYWILDLIRGSLYLFVVIVITYYAGVLVWKDRDERMDEIADSTPAPEWMSYASRLLTLMIMVMLMQTAALLGGIAVQTWHGYHRYQMGLYLHELLLRDASAFLFLSVLAFFIHVLSPNKYLGYFFYIAFLAGNAFAWQPLNVATNLVQFSSRPNVVHSDMFGDAPYRAAWNWYTLYWVFFCGLLAILTVMFWPRGKQDRWIGRRRNAAQRFHGGWISATLLCLLAFASTGGWIWYNTAIMNRLVGPKTQQRLQADYEKSYKQYEKIPLPRVRSVKYAIDVYPEARNIVMRGEQVIQNPFPQPINEIHFTVDPNYLTEIDIPGASLSKDDQKLYYRIYKFDPPSTAQRKPHHALYGEE